MDKKDYKYRYYKLIGWIIGASVTYILIELIKTAVS